MNFVLLDSEGGAIQGLIPIDAYDLITYRFAQGRLCELSRFTVIDAPSKFQAVIHPFALRLRKVTMVRSLDSSCFSIPAYILRPTALEEIGKSITRIDQLVDIIVRIASFGDIQSIAGDGGHTRVRHMYVVNERDFVIEVTLWDEFIDQFDVAAIVSESESSSCVVDCSSLQLRKVNEKYSLKTFLGTRFYFDQTIPEIAQFRSRLPIRSMAIFVGNAAVLRGFQLFSSGTYSRSDASRVTLHQLSQLASHASSEKFLCVAQITNVNTSFDWYYLSCPECHRRIHEKADKTFSCVYDHCPRDLVDPVAWCALFVFYQSSTV